MSTTAWRFSGTEAADGAVLKLRQLDAQKALDVQDVAVIRWPQFSAEPLVQEHVTDQGSKVSSFFKNLGLPDIDRAMIEAVKGDIGPGDSALVVLSSKAALDTVAKAFEGQGAELIRSDLSVQQEDQVRAAFSESAAHQDRPPGNVRKTKH
jgi:uncharacterized membrane protein